MTRHGEFSTNPAMLADLNAAAARAFSIACQRTLDTRLPPALEDKPLSSIQLSFVHSSLDRARGTPAIIAEELGVRTIDEKDLEFIDRRRSFENIPEDVKDRYRAIINGLAGVALSPGLQVVSHLPMEAIQSDYSAYGGDGTVYEAKTFDSRPLKGVIAAGKYFAEIALRYTQSDDFEKPFLAIPLGRHERIIRRGTDAGDPKQGRLRHYFGIDPSLPNLPLSGFEPREFLHGYRQTMIDAYEKRRERLRVLVKMGGFDAYLDMIKEGMVPYANAIKRVEAILDRKHLQTGQGVQRDSGGNADIV